MLTRNDELRELHLLRRIHTLKLAQAAMLKEQGLTPQAAASAALAQALSDYAKGNNNDKKTNSAFPNVQSMMAYNSNCYTLLADVARKGARTKNGNRHATRCSNVNKKMGTATGAAKKKKATTGRKKATTKSSTNNNSSLSTAADIVIPANKL
jgi:hypothetical protein